MNIGIMEALLTLRDQMSPALAAASANVQRFASQATGAVGPAAASVGSSLASIGQGAMVAGAALTALGGAATLAFKPAIESAMEYEKSLVHIETLTNASAETVKKWGADILSLAGEVGRPPAELAEALYFVASAGIEGDAAFQIMATSAKMAAIGMGETDVVARALTAAVNAYGEENLTAAMAGDILTQTVIEGGAEADEYARVLGRVLPIAAQLGVGLDEVGANMAVFTRLGVHGREAATALRGALNALAAPGKKASDALKELGLSGAAVRKQLKDEGLLSVLQTLMEKTGGNVETLDAIIPNIRALTGVLATAGSQAEEYSAALDRIQNADGQLEEGFGKWTKTAEAQWSQLKAQLSAVAIEIGTSLLPFVKALIPVLKDVATSVQGVAKWFAGLSETTRTVIASVVAFGGLALIAIGGILTAIAPLVTMFGTLAMAGVTVGGVMTTIGTILAALTGPVALVIAAVVALGAVWYKWGDDIKRIVAEVYEAAKAWLVDAWEGSIFQSIWNMLSAIADLFMAVAGKIATYAEAIYEVVREWVVDQIEAALQELQPVFTWFAEAWVWVKDNIIGSVVDIYNFVKGWLVDKISLAFAQLQGYIEGFTQVMRKAAEWLGYPMKEAALSAEKAAEGTKKVGAAADEVAPKVEKASTAMTGYKKTTEGAGLASKEAGDAAKKFAKDVEELAAKLTGAGQAGVAAEEIKKLEAAIVSVGSEWAMTAEDVDRFSKEFAKYGEAGRAAADKMKTAYVDANGGVKLLTLGHKNLNTLVAPGTPYLTFGDKVGAQAAKVKKGLDDQTEATRVAKAAADQLWQQGLISGAQYDALLKELGINLDNVKEKHDTFGEKLRNIGQGLTMLGQVFGGTFEKMATGLNTINDGWTQYQEAMSKAETGQDKLMAKIGLAAQVANVVGGMMANSSNKTMAYAGAALQGAAAGAKLGATFGPIGAGIGAVGGAILGLFNKKKQLKKEMDELRKKFEEQHGGLDNLKKKALEAGVSLDALFKAKDKKALEKAIDDVGKKLGTWEDAHKGLQEAADRYGLTIAELGPKFAEQKLNEQAGQLLQDYELLKASGADMVAVLAKMAPSMQDYIAQATAAGQSVPEQMRPMIESMIQQGLLLDANGNAFTSVEAAGITFAQTMDQQFSTLIEKIDAMVSALMGVSNVQVPAVTIPYRYRQEGPGPDNIPQPENPTEGHATGTGFKNFGSGTLAVLHGRERVQTEGQARAEAMQRGNADISDASMRRLEQSLAKSFRDSILKAKA